MDITLDYSGEVLGKYRLEQKLGNGSFGAVYKAYNGILQTYKALKIMKLSNPSEAKKIFREASIPYKCQHDNIVKINDGDVFKFKDEPVFVIDMDLVNGPSLEAKMEKEFLTMKDTLSIAEDILFALAYSHNNQIIHRDIKPANILIDNGVAKLSDFGLAQTLGSLVEPYRWYQIHVAPEVIMGNETATIQTDIYAFGMTLFRMVNNYSDWKIRTSNLDWKNLALKGKLLSTVGYQNYVPERIKRIINKCCAINPTDRYQNATELRNAITKLKVNIAWKKNNTELWEGSDNSGKIYSFKLENKKQREFLINIKINGRKKINDCKKFSNYDTAIEYMESYIKNSILF